MKKIGVFFFLISFVFSNNIGPGFMAFFINSQLSSSDENPQGETYRIEVGDVLEIVILGEEELSRTLVVMHNGNISFPLIGEVKVAGLTTDQAASLLVTRLKRYYTHPVVSIILQSPTSPFVSVFGQVERQGAVEYQRGLRITDYIALAGGPTPRANLGKVKVVRFKGARPVVMSTQSINVGRILKEGRIAQNFELKAGDWIYIPEKFTINWGTILTTLTLAVAALNLYVTVQNLE